jgi:NADH-quinone oxidoreductase subunit J
MTPVQIIFILVAVVTLGSALMVVTSRNLVRSALWLIAALFGVAIVFSLLEAAFLTVVQVVVYIGAISILMIFAIMMTRRVATDSGPRYNANWGWAVVVSAVFFAALGFILFSWPGLSTPLTPLVNPEAVIRQLGVALVSPNAYVLPFELASVLLLAALVGAIVVAWERKS